MDDLIQVDLAGNMTVKNRTFQSSMSPLKRIINQLLLIFGIEKDLIKDVPNSKNLPIFFGSENFKITTPILELPLPIDNRFEKNPPKKILEKSTSVYVKI